MQEVAGRRSFSRRDFLGFAGLGALGIGAATALGGCSPKEQGTGTQASEGPGASEGSEGLSAGIEVINAELLVVGTGYNAVNAIEQALAESKQVTVVDKGPFRHSGTSSMCWDAFSPMMAMDPDSYMAEYSTADRELYQAAYDFQPQPNHFITMIDNGQSLAKRTDDGGFEWYYVEGVCEGLFARREADTNYEQKNVTVYDNTMITGYLVNDGVCLGAMGLHVPTGTLRVFRANAVVVGTGGCCWIYGSFGLCSYANGSCDNTCDADMGAWRAGAAVGDAEFSQYDITSCEPRGTACGFGASITGDAQEIHAITDKNGALVFDPDDRRPVDSRIFFTQEFARVTVGEGRGTDNGGAYLAIGDTEIRYSNERNLQVFVRSYAIWWLTSTASTTG